jgi:hypothetical protein
MLRQGAETVQIALPTQSLENRRRGLSIAWVRDIPVAVWLVGIIVGAATVRFAIAMRMTVPWTIPDELVHAELAKSFAASGHFELRDVPFSAQTWGPLYLIAIAPAFRLFESLPDAFVAIKAINCVLMSCAAVPAYLLARRLLTRQTALFVAALTVAVPSGIYTSKIMAESLAYPLFLVAALAVVRALEERSWRRELLALAAIGLAILGRAQLVVLLPAFVLSLAVIAVVEERDQAGTVKLRPLLRRLGAYRVTTTTVAALAAFLALGKVIGVGPAGVAGAHNEAFGAADPVAVAQLLVLHLAELDLYLTLLPLVALAILTARAFRRGSPWRELRPFCAFTVTLSCCMLLLSSKYLAAVYSDTFLHAYDRYIFYLAPLYLIVFFVWLKEGMPRPRTARVWVAGAALLPLVIASRPLLSDAWGNPSMVGLAPWAFARLLWGVTPVYALLLVGGAYLAWAALRCPDRRWLVVLVVVNLLVTNYFVANRSVQIADAAQRNWIGPGVQGDWIDAAVGGNAEVVVLWSGLQLRGTRGWHSIWEAELLNRSVRGVYDLRDPQPYAVPEPKLETRGHGLYLPSGRPLSAQYVLTDLATPVVGATVAVIRPIGMTLYRVGGRVELLSNVDVDSVIRFRAANARRAAFN